MTDARMEKWRLAMVDLLARRDIADQRVLQAMAEVPREEFVPVGLRQSAYEDIALPIEAGQTISQPYVVAEMLQLAEIGPGDTVLEVGAGSGYAAAVMGLLAHRVISVERQYSLAETARRRVAKLGFRNVEVVLGDGSNGWPDAAPFDAIVVAAGGTEVPPALKEQLKVGGRLVIPIRQRVHQVLMRFRRTGPETFEQDSHGVVAFVPLVSGIESPPASEDSSSATDGAG